MAERKGVNDRTVDIGDLYGDCVVRRVRNGEETIMDLDRFWVGALAVLAIWLILAVAGVLIVRRWSEEAPEEPLVIRQAREVADR